MLSEVSTVSCPKCKSEAVSTVPAEIRLYRNGPRTLSHPPMYPSPDIKICLECGWSEFTVPDTWLAAWLRPQPRHPEPQPIAQPISQKVMRPIPVAVAS